MEKDIFKELLHEIRKDYEMDAKQMRGYLKQSVAPATTHLRSRLKEWKWWRGGDRTGLNNNVKVVFNSVNYMMWFQAEKPIVSHVPEKVFIKMRAFNRNKMYQKVKERLLQKNSTDYASLILQSPVRRWPKAQKTVVYNKYIQQSMNRQGYAGYKELFRWRKYNRPFIVELSVKGYEEYRRKKQKKAMDIFMEKLVEIVAKRLVKRYGEKASTRNILGGGT
jgi:hypothetical protein